MQPRLSFVSLGVKDLARATQFYEHALQLPRIPMPPEADIAFFELGATWLALYPRELLAKDAGTTDDGRGFAGFTLAHNVKSAAEVDRVLADIISRGGRLARAAKHADWGGYSGYFADPDGFLWEVAWNPHFPHV